MKSIKTVSSLLLLIASVLGLGACQTTSASGDNSTRPHHVHADGSIHYE